MKREGKKDSPLILGIDHGYGLIKTVHTVFRSGIKKVPTIPPFMHNILNYEGSYYAVGQTRQNHKADKTLSDDYYLLTLAAIAEELKKIGTNHADQVILATGLPYSFMGSQKDSFKEYLLKNKNIRFNYEGLAYRVNLEDVYVFPQGFPIIAPDLDKYQGNVTVVDIGSRTVDVLTFRSGKVQYDKSFSIDKGGVIDCMGQIREAFVSKYQIQPDEQVVQDFLAGGEPKGMTEEQGQFVAEIVEIYLQEVLSSLDARGIMDFTTVVYCGGGAGILKRFGEGLYDKDFSRIVSDIHANAKGYEQLCRSVMGGGRP